MSVEDSPLSKESLRIIDCKYYSRDLAKYMSTDLFRYVINHKQRTIQRVRNSLHELKRTWGLNVRV